MSSIGTGYDLSVTTYSPDGRLYQIEYAQKAVENSGTAMGICCTDGVVLGVEKLIPFKMMEPTSTRRIFNADRHVGIAVCGWQPDGRQMVNKARSECISYRDFYGNKIPAKILVERLSLRFHYYTLYWSMRALGTTVLVATYDEFGPSLHMIEPSGETNGYYGIAIGKGKQSGKTELEKLQLDKMTCKEAIKQIARIIYNVHDFVKDKEFELELSWICKESNYQHEMVPEKLKKEAIDAATESLKEKEKEEDVDIE